MADEVLESTLLAMCGSGRRRSRRSAGMDDQLLSVVRLWILRILVQLRGSRQFMSASGFNDDDLARQIGLGAWVDTDEEFKLKPVVREMVAQYRQSEADAASVQIPDVLHQNVACLADMIDLTPAQCRVLEFAILLHSEAELKTAVEYLGTLNRRKFTRSLSVILDMPESEIEEALSADGTLVKSGFLDLGGRHGIYGDMDSILNLPSGVTAVMTDTSVEPETLLRKIISPANPGTLGLGDYPHLASGISVIKTYLARVVESGRKGVNILLYGSPGTGKTELTKALAQELGCELFDISSEDEDGDVATASERFKSYRMSQSMLAKRPNTLISFDEAEDVFGSGGSGLSMFGILFGRRGLAQQSKGWVNRMLESNVVPTLWLSNSVDCLDPAFVRRFDFVLEMSIPPKSVRAGILKQASDGLLDDREISRLAESKALAPAVVTRAVSVVRSIQDTLDEQSIADTMDMIIGNTLEAQRERRIPKTDPARLPDVYDSSLINTDPDLSKLAEGLVRSRSGRLCFYGPPGTGKTALGRWLAERLDVPLHVKRVSDLQSKWVGEAEKNIAKAFREAQAENAVLLIDEVDSFLQDRGKAQRSWEITQVNEMLTQMESYSGVFIASTNLMDGLDEASLRRFDLKVRFDYLKPEQGGILFGRHCAAMGLQQTESSLASVRSLGNLAPGDFAAVIRQSKFRPFGTADDFAAALQDECALKKGRAKSGRIGF